MKARHAAVMAGLALGLMSGAALAAPITFSYVDPSAANNFGFQSYTVGMSGLYEIVAYGAQGGANSQFNGGKGAALGGEFRLVQNQVLSIAVGGRGGNGGPAAGGGGTFVTLAGSFGRASDTALVIAGGGGGAGDGEGRPGFISPSGAGNGGITFVSGVDSSSAAGGGFFTNGEDGVDNSARGGSSYINGLAGGTGDQNGGFGGGGGAGSGLDPNAGGGGGGGFSGGNSSDIAPGGGGSSYLANFAMSQTIASSGFNAGDGYVTLEYVTSPVPLPASAPMFGAALMALGAVGYGLKRKGKAAAAA